MGGGDSNSSLKLLLPNVPNEVPRLLILLIRSTLYGHKPDERFNTSCQFHRQIESRHRGHDPDLLFHILLIPSCKLYSFTPAITDQAVTGW